MAIYMHTHIYTPDINSLVLMFQGYIQQRKYSFYGVLFEGLAQLVKASYSHAQKPATAMLLKFKGAYGSQRVPFKMHVLIREVWGGVLESFLTNLQDADAVAYGPSR